MRGDRGAHHTSSGSRAQATPLTFRLLSRRQRLLSSEQKPLLLSTRAQRARAACTHAAAEKQFSKQQAAASNQMAVNSAPAAIEAAPMPVSCTERSHRVSSAKNSTHRTARGRKPHLRASAEVAVSEQRAASANGSSGAVPDRRISEMQRPQAEAPEATTETNC
jgi:hypothetical protein